MTQLVHPSTGELLDELERQPPERLAEVYVAVKDEIARLEAFRRALKDELQNRLTIRSVAVMTVGEFEVGQKYGRKSVWDGDALYDVVRDLLDQSVVTHRDVDGVVVRTTKVNGTKANSLSARLLGEHKAAVENCRHWEQDVRGFDVVPSLPLISSE